MPDRARPRADAAVRSSRGRSAFQIRTIADPGPAVRIAIDIDSTLHDHWPLLAAAAKRRFGVDLPYDQQLPWAVRRLSE
jgi:hypothetical protein